MDSPIAFMLLLVHVFRKKRRIEGGGGYVTFCSQTLKIKKLEHKKKEFMHYNYIMYNEVQYVRGMVMETPIPPKT